MPPPEPQPDDDELEAEVPLSIRAEYERLGPAAYYRLHGATYRNPHEFAIEKVLSSATREWTPDLSNVLDLAAGSGEVTLAMRSLGAISITGVDPFTHVAYQARTAQLAERWTFEAIAGGALVSRRYSLIVCSFAMHLVDPSRLPGLVMQLAMIAPSLWILTPHKRPRLDPAWGFELAGEMVVDRVRIRNHRSTLFAWER